MSKGPHILFLVPYPEGKAPSQRFRIEQYYPALEAAGISYATHSFWDNAAYAALYSGGSAVQKAAALLKGYLRRIGTVLGAARKADYVFIQREAAPLGPPIFEWIIAKLLRKKIIFDYDDAIWVKLDSGKHGWASMLKCHWKAACICRWAHKVAGGNDYLCDYARRQGAKTVIKIPTVVDTEGKYSLQKTVADARDAKPVIGWTGSHSTLLYLREMTPILQALDKELDYTFLVIADENPQLPIRDQQFIRWSEATEAADLLKMDVGVMPLPEDPWSEGKCGFKLIQYFAVGLPAVASPVGVNKKIVSEGVNGYLCTANEEWVRRLKELILDADKRRSFGQAGRNRAVTDYSISSQAHAFVNLFIN